MAGYSGIQRDTAAYSGIQRDMEEIWGMQRGAIRRDAAGYTAGCSAIQRDTVRYSGMMFITQKHDTHTVRSLSTPSRSCQPGAAVRLCVIWQPGRHPRASCNLQGLGGCCLRITMAGCSTKVCAQQARVVVSKVEEPEEEEEKRSEEKDQILGASETDSTTASAGSGSSMEEEAGSRRAAAAAASRTGIRRK